MLETITYYKDYQFKVGDNEYTDITNNILQYRYLDIKKIEDYYYNELGLQEIRKLHIFLRELKIFKLMNKEFSDKKFQNKILYNSWEKSGMYGTFSGNVFTGYPAGQTISTGNVFIGRNAGYQTTTGSYGVPIGYSAGTNISIGNNNLSIGKSYSTITISN